MEFCCFAFQPRYIDSLHKQNIFKLFFCLPINPAAEAIHILTILGKHLGKWNIARTYKMHGQLHLRLFGALINVKQSKIYKNENQTLTPILLLC